LDGKKNNFYTFFFSESSSTNRINNSNILMKSHSYLKGLSLNKIIKKQFAVELIKTETKKNFYKK